MINEHELSRYLIRCLDKYFHDLGKQDPRFIHKMVIDSIEKPLIEYILEKTKFNQTEAAKMLGMNRNTLRKKIQLYNISINQ